MLVLEPMGLHESHKPQEPQIPNKSRIPNLAREPSKPRETARRGDPIRSGAILGREERVNYVRRWFLYKPASKEMGDSKVKVTSDSAGIRICLAPRAVWKMAPPAAPM